MTPAPPPAASQLDPAVHWTFVECPGAQWLVVTFPGVTGDQTYPEVWRDEAFRGYAAHRLYFGTSGVDLMHPDGYVGSARKVGDLTSELAARYGVPLSRVVCQGHSLGATVALLIGIWAGVGEVVVGAPCVRLGSWGRKLAQLQSVTESSEAEDRTTERCLEMQENPEMAAALDRLVPAALEAAVNPPRVTLYISKSDSFFAVCLWLRNEMALQGRDCTVTLGNYFKHDDLEELYYGFAGARFKNLLPPAPAPSAAPAANEGRGPRDREGSA